MSGVIALALFLGLRAKALEGGPVHLPDVASREIDVTAGLAAVPAPDRGLVTLSDGSGAAAFLVREAGHLRCQASRDGGATFAPEVEVSTADSRPVLDHRAVLAPDGTFLALWAAPDPSGDRALWLSRSTDGGATWSAPFPVVNGSLDGHGADAFALAAGSGGRTAVAWARGGAQSVHVRVSPDGASWLSPVMVLGTVTDLPRVIQSLDVGLGPVGDVHVAYVDMDPRGAYQWRLFTSRSTDGGATFEAPVQRNTLFPSGSRNGVLNADLEVDDDGTVLVTALVQSVRWFGLLRSTDHGATFAATLPLAAGGFTELNRSRLKSWPGTQTIALLGETSQKSVVVGLSLDGGASFQDPTRFGLDVLWGSAALERVGDTSFAVTWIDRGNVGVHLAVTANAVGWGETWFGADDGRFLGMPLPTAVIRGAGDGMAVLWEEPRAEPATTSIWGAWGSSSTLLFDPPGQLDQDAHTSRPNADPFPALASDGERHVITVFPVATRSERPDLLVSASSDQGRTFTSPMRLGNDAPGAFRPWFPAAALGSEGVAWVLVEDGSLRLHRSGDFGVSWSEAPVPLGPGSGYGFFHVAMAGGGVGVAVWTNFYGSGVFVRGGGPGTPLQFTTLGSDTWDAAVCAEGAHVGTVVTGSQGMVGRRSLDAGLSFESARPLSRYAWWLDAACAGDEMTAVWMGAGYGTGVWAATLTPDGWTAASQLGPAAHAFPRVVRHGHTVVAAWDEDMKVWVAHSGDGGRTWQPAHRLDDEIGGGRNQNSWNVSLTGDAAGRAWVFWEEEVGSEASIVVRRSDDGGAAWGPVRRLTREQPQHAFERHGYPDNARAASLPGAGFLAYAGPETSDWSTAFVNADDALDADRDGVPDGEDCAPEDPDTQLCGGPPVAVAGADRTVECTGGLSAVVHLDGTASTDPDGDLASSRWSEGDVTLATSASADVTLLLGVHTLTLQVTDAAGASDSDGVKVDVADTHAPAGRITFPEQGACYGPAQLPVVLEDDAADVCDPSPTRTITPATSFDTHGDHSATLLVQDASGLALESAVEFTIDTVSPSVAFTTTSGRIDPGHLPLTLAVLGDDGDGANGGVVRERIFLGECLALDGTNEGDADGLLSDEALSLSVGDLCAMASRCGFSILSEPELRIEALDCAGNAGSATVRLAGVFPAQGVCRSPRAKRVEPSRRAVSLQPR